jgi:hypothetical protein
MPNGPWCAALPRTRPRPGATHPRETGRYGSDVRSVRLPLPRHRVKVPLPVTAFVKLGFNLNSGHISV